MSECSSQPSLMARMLEAFTVSEGDRVLEIGTGTGYNTALLCHRLGAEHVVSVDIDPALTEAARHKLGSIGYEPEIITGDGTAGHPARGPYDGILATCGVHRIPHAWLHQLRPGAVIVTNIGAGIVRLVMQDDATATGRYLPEEAGFMPARPTNDHTTPTPAHYTAQIVNAPGHTRTEPLPVPPEKAADFYHSWALSRTMEVVLLHHDVLGMTLHNADTTIHGLIHPPTQSWARAIPNTTGTTADVTTAGPRDLWTERLDLLTPWAPRQTPRTRRLQPDREPHRRAHPAAGTRQPHLDLLNEPTAGAPPPDGLRFHCRAKPTARTTKHALRALDSSRLTVLAPFRPPGPRELRQRLRQCRVIDRGDGEGGRLRIPAGGSGRCRFAGKHPPPGRQRDPGGVRICRKRTDDHTEVQQPVAASRCSGLSNSMDHA
ncbi:methyltransferase domain-containing protein [Streptomyces sp. 4N509B]|uniref:methyltransferase domain-containing protein n=1 Tax=Streptomyces sp. 4N509B TaxID=3457413 RepID=UPI003FD4439E